MYLVRLDANRTLGTQRRRGFPKWPRTTERGRSRFAFASAQIPLRATCLIWARDAGIRRGQKRPRRGAHIAEAHDGYTGTKARRATQARSPGRASTSADCVSRRHRPPPAVTRKRFRLQVNLHVCKTTSWLPRTFYRPSEMKSALGAGSTRAHHTKHA